MEKVRLGDIVDIYLGLTHTPKYVEKGVPFLSVKDISNGKIDFSKCHYITEEEFNTLPVGAKPQVGDMLFCRVGTIGKPLIIKEGTSKFGSFVSLGFLRITRKDYLLDYVKHWMLSNDFRQQVMKNVKGVAQINLNTSWLKKFELPKIEIKKQQKIIRQLDKVQEIINLRKKQIEELDELIKSHFVEMFESEEYPKKTLNELTNKITDGSHNPPTGIAENEGYMMLSSQNIINNSINYENVRFLKKEDFEKENLRTNLNRGDVLLTIVGTVGRTAIITDETNITLQRSVAVLKPTKEINSIYLVGVINSDDVIRQLNKGAKGVAQKGIYLNDIKKILIAVPPIELQNQFAEIVKQIDKQKFILEKSLKETEELQESLMNKYFGE